MDNGKVTIRKEGIHLQMVRFFLLSFVRFRLFFTISTFQVLQEGVSLPNFRDGVSWGLMDGRQTSPVPELLHATSASAALTQAKG